MRLCHRLLAAAGASALVAVGGTATAQMPPPLQPADPIQFQPTTPLAPLGAPLPPAAPLPGPTTPPADLPAPKPPEALQPITPAPQPTPITPAPQPTPVTPAHAPTVLPPGTTSGAVPVVPPTASPTLLAPPPAPVKGVAEGCGVPPVLAVKQSLPESISPGQAVTADVSVTNTGTKTAENVVLAGWWTAGYELAESSATAQAVNGRKAWGLGSIPAGETRIVRVKLAPQPGTAAVEFRSGFDATCSAAAEMKAVKVVKPELAVVVEGAEVAFVGQPVSMHLKVKNPSGGAVDKVFVKVELPDTLVHPKGASLESEIATLAAGTSEAIPLHLTAVKAGEGKVRVRVSAPGCDTLTHEIKVGAVEARVSVAVSGPKTTYQNWPVTFEAVVENQGDQALKGATFEVKLPAGLSDLRASDKPGYDAAGHRLVWKLDDLKAGEKKTVFWFGFAKQTDDLATVGTANIGGIPLKRAEQTTKNLGPEGK